MKAQETEQVKDDKPKLPPTRRAKRAFARHAAQWGRVRTGKGTGSTPHFKMWSADLKIKSTLQRMRVRWLSEHLEDPTTAKAYALLADGYKNVWDLVNAERADLLKVKGIGPAALKLIQTDLASHRVSTRWSETDS